MIGRVLYVQLHESERRFRDPILMCSGPKALCSLMRLRVDLARYSGRNRSSIQTLYTCHLTCSKLGLNEPCLLLLDDWERSARSGLQLWMGFSDRFPAAVD